MKTNLSVNSSPALSYSRPALRRAALVLGIALSAASAQAQTYTLTPINPPAGSVGSTVFGMNNHGAVVGATSVKSGKNTVAGPAFVWAAGTSAALTTPLSASCAANDISDTGLIVGRTGGSPTRAVWWQAAAGGGYATGDWNALLPVGSPLFLHEAMAVSADGQFVVFDGSNSTTGLWGAVVARLEPQGLTLWTIPTIGDPPVNLRDSLADDIHFDGTTVRLAGSYTPEGTNLSLAFRWELDVATGATAMTGLDSRQTNARSVNSSGTAAGYTYLGYLACVWHADGTMQQLPTLGGTTNAANSINDAGYAVGWSARSGRNATNHAFLWHAATGTRDLNALKSPADTSGLELTTAYQINSAGQILARGVTKTTSANVLLTPAP
jgi:uncharacterized membrane protein